MKHVTVLEEEAVTQLHLSKDATVVDCTFGSGGHAQKILEQLDKSGTYVGIDVDETALEAPEEKDTKGSTVHLVKGNFREIKSILQQLNVATVDAILADLGWRIEQFDGNDDIRRGFSFNKNEPILMTYGNPSEYPFTAHDIVNEWKEEDIANVLFAYGEERFSRKIARSIVATRNETPITTANELADIVVSSVPAWYRRKKTHPATKTFQALRIAVNDEFDALRMLLNDGFELLESHGRMAIITFHSLEDKIVKETFRSFVQERQAVLVNKKPITPETSELERNPRSRSAKLRVIEKI